jgi:hypothetical protein
MGGTSKQSQSTSQTATRNPWEPTQGALQGIIGQLNGQVGQAGTNATEQGAFNTLSQNAQAGNPYASQIGSLASNLLSGGGADQFAPAVQANYDQYMSGAYSDPNQNNALRQQLDLVRSDVGNSVNSMFAGAGRDLSGSHLQTLGRGISQGYAPYLMQAGQQAYDAGNNTQGILAGLNQQGLSNQQAGVDASTAALTARDSGANQILNIEQMKRSLPTSNLANIAGLLTPLAQLGGEITSNGNAQGSQTMSPAQQAWGWMNAFSNLNKSWG